MAKDRKEWPTFVFSDSIIEPILDALELDARTVSRVILDLQCGEVPIICVVMAGTEKLINVDWEKAFKGQRVIKVE